MSIGQTGNNSFDSSGLKALILTRFSDPTPNGNYNFNEVVGTLDSLEIQKTFIHLESLLSQTTLANSYDFVVIPFIRSVAGETDYTAIIDDPTVSVPIISMHGGGGIGIFGSSPGIDTSTITGNSIRWIASKYWNNGCSAQYTRSAKLTTGQPIITIANNDYLTGNPISDAGYASVWYYESNGNPRYGSYAGSGMGSLYFILKDMEDRGIISLSSVRRPAIGVDIDHTNNTSKSERDLWFPLIGKNAVHGITDTHVQESSCESSGGLYGWPPSGFTQEQIDWLNEVADLGGEFSYHTHQAPRELVGSWPMSNLGGSLSYNDTKQNIDARYSDDDNQLYTYTGLHLNARHYNPGANNIGILTAQLFTPDTAVYADANDSSLKTGKSYRTFRNTSFASVWYPGKSFNGFISHSQHRQTSSMCGIHIVWSGQLVVSSATINNFSSVMVLAMWSLMHSPTLIYTHPFYFCEADGYYGKDPWTLLTEIYDSLGFVRYFSHVADEYPHIDISLA